jgi:hypothetical protein
MPVSALIWPIKGVKPVSAGRRLAARSTIPNTSSTPETREGGRWPGVAVAVASFVMLRLSSNLAAAAL